MDKPSQIYNFDEVGVPLDQFKKSIIVHQVTKIKSLWLLALMLLEVLCHLMLCLMLKT